MLKVPETLKSEADALVTKLKNSLGNDLVSVTAYGRWLTVDNPERTADLNLMVIVNEITTEKLDCIADARRGTGEAQRWQLLTLSNEDLAGSTDIFPIKYLNMQRRHCVLHGEDVLSTVEVARTHLRFRCEQEIKNLMLRLRYFYLNRNQNQRAMRATLIRAHQSLMSSLAVLVELKTGKVPADRDEIITEIGKLDIDAAPLAESAKLEGDGVMELDVLKKLYEQTMALVRQAARVADQA